MIDFLDTVRPASNLLDQRVTSSIRCDSDQCLSSIIVPNDIDEAQSMAIARAAGCTARLGAVRAYHCCVRCSEVKR